MSGLMNPESVKELKGQIALALRQADRIGLPLTCTLLRMALLDLKAAGDDVRRLDS